MSLPPNTHRSQNLLAGPALDSDSSRHLRDVLLRDVAEKTIVGWPTELAKVPHHAGMAEAWPTNRATTTGQRLLHHLVLALALRLDLLPDLLPGCPLPGSSGSLCPCSMLSIELGQNSLELGALLVDDQHGSPALINGGCWLDSHWGGCLGKR